MNLGNYSKLIGALVGNVVAIILAWLAINSPAIAECVPVPETTESVCNIFGFSQVQVTAALMAIFNMIFVERFPANKPS